MKSMPEQPSSILPKAPADVGRGDMSNVKVGTPPGLNKIRGPKG